MSNREPLVAQRYGPSQQDLRSEAAVLDPGRLLRILRRNWLWLVLPPLLLATVGGLLAAREPSRYEAMAMVVLQQTAAQDRLSGDRSNALAEREIQTEAKLLNGPAIAALIRAELGSDIDFDAQAVEGTDLVELTAQAGDAELAASAADTIAELYIGQRRDRIEADLETAATELEEKIAGWTRELEAIDASLAAAPASGIGVLNPGEVGIATETQADPALVRRQTRLEDDLAVAEASLEELRSELALTNGDARIAAVAIPPTDRISPKPVRATVVWAMLGVLVGLGLVWLRDLLDRRIRSTADIAPFSASLDFAGPVFKPDPVSLIGPASLLFDDVADRFRVLANSSLTIGDDQPLLVQVTGVQGGEGSTFVAANLAATFASGGWATVLVDADLAGGDLHKIFGVEARPGTKQLLGGERLAGVVQATRLVHGLGVVARGTRGASDATLHTATLAEFLKRLSDRFDVVVVDSPPILRSGDAAVLASHVDKTIVVAAMNETTQPELGQAVEAVAASGGRVTAIALTEPSRAIVSTPAGPLSAVADTDGSVPSYIGTTTAELPAQVPGNHLRPRPPEQDARSGTSRPASSA
ncbi:MAG: P-loop NTPase [Acidimicrobiales bacterium]